MHINGLLVDSKAWTKCFSFMSFVCGFIEIVGDSWSELRLVILFGATVVCLPLLDVRFVKESYTRGCYIDVGGSHMREGFDVSVCVSVESYFDKRQRKY